MLVAIDTSTGYSSLALHDGHQVRAEYTWEAPRRHTVELLPRLKSAFEQLQIGVDHLSAGPHQISDLVRASNGYDPAVLDCERLCHRLGLVDGVNAPVEQQQVSAPSILFLRRGAAAARPPTEA